MLPVEQTYTIFLTTQDPVDPIFSGVRIQSLHIHIIRPPLENKPLGRGIVTQSYM